MLHSTSINVVVLAVVAFSFTFPHVSFGQCNYYNTTIAPNYSTINKTQIFEVGSIGTFSNPLGWTVSRWAADLINNSTSILPNVYLRLRQGSLLNSNANALTAAQSMISNDGVRVFIGGTLATECKTIQLPAKISMIPQIVPVAVSSALSNKFEYPYLTRVIPSDYVQAQAIYSLVKMKGWRQVMVVFTNEETGLAGWDNMNKFFKDSNITLYPLQVLPSQSNYSSSISTMKDMIDKYRLRIIVLYTTYALTPNWYPQLYAAGLIGSPKFAYIFVYGMGTALTANPNISTIPWIIGGVVLGPKGGSPGPVYDAAFAAWQSADPVRYPVTPAPARPDLAINWYFYDAVMTLALALDSLLNSGLSLSQVTGPNLLASIAATNFTGVTGQISMDSNYDRTGDFAFFRYSTNTSANTIPTAIFSPRTGSIQVITPFTFYGGVTDPRDGLCTCYKGTCDDNDVCVCDEGYSGDDCTIYRLSSGDGLSTPILIVVIVIPVVALLSILAGAVRYTRYKRVKVMKEVSDKQRSVIKREDITLDHSIGRGAAGVVYKGMFRGTEVAVKQLIASNASQKAVQDFEFESAIMTGLRHPNLVMFMGSCFVPQLNEMLLVMEFMEKGSLNDILHNPKLNLPHEMIVHIALHAAKGVNFLHQSSPPIIHCDLKSHNILLDNKWNAKISDFGITKIKEISANSQKATPGQFENLGTIYWTAPEIFNMEAHSEKSDCYSFGIILWELTHRRVPYHGREPMAVTMDVSLRGLRPKIDDSVDPKLKDLMTECWAQEPDKRPFFEDIVARLRQLSSSHPMVNFWTKDAHTEAPTGKVVLVQTEISYGNILWDTIPTEMLEATCTHNNLIRNSLDTFNGYEVEATPNGFLVAFEKSQDALNWCTHVQISLLNVSWNTILLQSPSASVVRADSGTLLWSGLRVRMAVNMGVPNQSTDGDKIKYFGAVVDCIGNLLERGKNSQIIVSSAAAEEFKKQKCDIPITIESCGVMSNTTRNTPDTVYRITINSLAERETYANMALPHSVVDVDFSDVSSSSTNSWVIPFESLAIKHSLGRGAVGDFYAALWNEKEVAVKMLVNQKLDESDMLRLRTTAAKLSKIQHPNLIEVYGVCFKPGNFAVVTPCMPNSTLFALLSNQSAALSFPQKVRIARSIAAGMACLTSYNDPQIAIHGSLKSANVLVNLGSGAVKVTDHGQSNLKELARTLTSIGAVSWTAPEVLTGDTPTPMIAVYSFGIMLWELLTRQVPYQGEHPIRLLSKILEGFRPTVPADCPPPYRQLMEQCWQENPEARPSFFQICTDLDKM